MHVTALEVYIIEYLSLFLNQSHLLPPFPPSFLSFFHTELVHCEHCTPCVLATPISLFPHPPFPKISPAFMDYVFSFDKISHSLLCDWLLLGPLFSGASTDSHSCELVKGGVIASLENGFSQPFTPSYSSRILPAPAFTMWASEEMVRLIAWLELFQIWTFSLSHSERWFDNYVNIIWGLAYKCK